MKTERGKVIELLVRGRPVPQPRPSVTRTGAVYYRDNGIKEYREAIQQAAMVYFFGEPWGGPIEIEFLFRFVRPKSHFNADGHTLSAGGRSQPLPTAGDIDNFVKGATDALEGLAFYDDKQIAKLTAEKVWGDSEATEIRITRRAE